MRQTPNVQMVYVRLLTVPPIALGAWSMALVLWQPPEYYYYSLTGSNFKCRAGNFSHSTIVTYYCQP